MARGRKVGEAYGIQRLHRWFLASALAFLASMVWMFFDDFNRPWKRYQREFLEMQRKRAEQELKKESASQKELAKLKTKETEVEKEVSRQQSKVDGLRKELDLLETKLVPEEMAWRFAKSFVDTYRFERDHAMAEVLEVQKRLREHERAKETGMAERARHELEGKRKKLAAAEKHLDDALADLEEKRLVVEKRKAEIAVVRAKLHAYVGALEEVQKQQRALVSRREDLEGRIRSLQTGLIFAVRNAPMLDMLNPNLRVQQVVLPDLRFNISFADIQVVDRCMTCHMAVDKPGWEVQAQKDREPEQVADLAARLGAGSIRIVKAGTDRTTRSIPKAELKTWQRVFGEHLKVEKQGKEEVSVSVPAAVNVEHPYQHPFRSHSHLGLFMSAASAHPMGRFGCQSCHSGAGEATDFVRAVHMPASAAQQARWEADYSWKPIKDMYWNKPMYPRPHTESGCVTCHVNVVDLAPMPWVTAEESGKQNGKDWPGHTVYEGKELFLRHGCVGCHKVESIVGEPKIGPWLGSVATKLDRSWMRRWIEAPRDFRAATYMPHVFKIPHQMEPLAKVEATETDFGSLAQSNPKSVEEGRRLVKSLAKEKYRTRKALYEGIADAEMDSVVEYLWQNSEHRTLKKPAVQGDAQRGKELFLEKGCLGCHVSEDYTLKGQPAKRFGPELAGMASKLAPATATQWLYSWITDPRSYSPSSRMPHVRVTEEEAAHLAAWLLTKRNAAFEEKKVAAADPLLVKMRLVTFLEANMSTRQAWEIANRLDEATQRAWLGEKVISRQGCFGCHEMPKGGGRYVKSRIEGDAELVGYLKANGLERFTKVMDFNEMLGIGTELTDWGRKLMPKLDFGLQHHIPFTRQAFISHKLDTPRLYDEGLFKSYDDMLRMPHFGFSKDEIGKIATYVIGLRKTNLHQQYRYADSADNWKARAWEKQAREGQLASQWTSPSTRRQAIIEGRKLVQRYNCTGCHQIEGRGWELKNYLHQFKYGGTPATLSKARSDSPPWLDFQGQRTRTAWLFDFLREPEKFLLRPWLGVRMPDFRLSVEDANALTRYFAALDGAPWPNAETWPAPSEVEFQAAHKIFKENDCFSCHREKPAAGKEGAPDLELAGPRLREQWTQKWVLDPKVYIPFTSMPDNLFREVRGDKMEYIEGAHEKAKAVTKVILHPPSVARLKKELLK